MGRESAVYQHRDGHLVVKVVVEEQHACHLRARASVRACIRVRACACVRAQLSLFERSRVCV
jgi:hypothetical protein